MKKNLILLSLIFILFACNNNEFINEDSILAKDPDDLIFIPDEGNPPVIPTGVVKPSTDWRSWETITLSSGAIVTTPWSTNGPTLNFNEDIYLDFEPEDGWDLIWSTITGEANRDPQVNYLLFYNRLSGILRVFYYNESSNIQNGALWQLDLTSSPNSLFNACSDHFSYPSKYTNKFLTNDIKNPSIANTNNGGFGRGWNYFQLELAYDPNYTSNVKMSILPRNIKVANVNINGSYNLYSEGTIISSSKRDLAKGIKDGIATSIGKLGAKWLVDSLNVKNKTSEIISQGTSAIIKSGVNLVLGSFLGFTNKTQTTTQKLQFTTTGTATFEGTILEEGDGGLPGVSHLPMFADEKFQERLGLWNLQDDPIIYLKRYVQCPGNHGGGALENPWEEFPTLLPPSTTLDGDFTYDPIYRIDHKIIINPAVTPYIKKYTSKAELIKYQTYEGSRQRLYAGTLPYNKTVTGIEGITQSKILYQDANLFLFHEPVTTCRYMCPFPSCTSPRKIDMKNESTSLFPDHVIKVTVQFDIVYQGKEHTLYSTRTYKPRYEWYENNF